MTARVGLEGAKWFLFRHFERLLVVVLVVSLLLIHWLADYKLAFLSFYYLPIIAAGFFVGRNTAVLSAVFVVALVAFFQAVQGLDGSAGFTMAIMLTLIPWAGFLVLTGYAVGHLADQRKARLADLKGAYLAVLEVLTFYLESAEKSKQGHSHRVATLAVALGQEMLLPEDELENIRVAALLHEVGLRDARLMRLLQNFPGSVGGLPMARAMRRATDVLQEYERYYEVVGGEWPLEHLGLSTGTRILAVADAYETLQMPTPLRPAFAPWTAVEEIERSAGKMFDPDVTAALRRVSAVPKGAGPEPELSLVKTDTA